MGGTERLAKHHGKGKLDARTRLARLLDKGSFREFGTLVGGDAHSRLRSLLTALILTL
jgi:methylmalonyl-CoA decarboxylase subunit alpha